jgi:2-keto-4-pentenoate hydratase
MTARPAPGAGAEPAAVAAVAEIVAAHRIEHRSMGDLPPELQPASYEPIEAIMHAIHHRIPWPTAGWKVGAASEEVQRLERLPGPVPGRLYRHRIHRSGARLGRRVFINHRNTECEFAFTLDRDLPARTEPYTVAEVGEAVSTMTPVIELGDSVFTDWYGASRYYGPCLDNGGGAGMVVGTATTAWREVDLAEHAIRLYVNGELRKQGKGSAAMGHPLTSLAWLANWTSSYGIDLKADELMSTGTCTGHCFAEAGDEVVADFGPFGEVRVRYTLDDGDRDATA